MDLVECTRPCFGLLGLFSLLFFLKTFSLNLFLNKLFSFFLEFYIQHFIIMFHNTLYSHGRGYNISETSHPHIALIVIFSTQNEKTLGGLDVERELPVFGKIFFVDFTFWKVTILYVSKRNYFLIGFNLSIYFFICAECFFSNENAS